jgi:hypothetical protein
VPGEQLTSRRLHPLRWMLRAAAVMKVRRPECDEHPSKPSSLNSAANQLTTLVGRKQPPRAERMTGPNGSLIRNKLRSAWRRSGCMGMRRPPRFLAIASWMARMSATLPRAARAIDHSSPAISQARRPALIDKRIITRSRAGNGAIDVLRNIRRNIWGVTTLACLPGILRNSLGGGRRKAGAEFGWDEMKKGRPKGKRNDLGDGGLGTTPGGVARSDEGAALGFGRFSILPRASL